MVKGRPKRMGRKRYWIEVEWGKAFNKTSKYEFRTMAEAEAFIHGADEAAGWMEFRVTKTNFGYETGD